MLEMHQTIQQSVNIGINISTYFSYNRFKTNDFDILY